MSAAFDTVDHAIVLQRLQTTGGFSHTRPSEDSTYVAGPADLPSFTWCVASLKAQCWGQFYLFSTLST